jgi:formylglycine-generating enzyme
LLAQANQQAQAVTTTEVELTFWNSVKDSENAALLNAYIKRYPNGAFVEIAKLKIEKLARGSDVSTSSNVGTRTTVKSAPQEKTNSADGLTYVWIPPGNFSMGCSADDPECFDNEKPSHQVTITKGFWIGRTVVSQDAYKRVTQKNPSYFFKGPNVPVNSVRLEEAKAYCSAIGGRLPTEAEWEYAARSGSNSARYGDLEELGLFGGVGMGMPEVGSKKANSSGVQDVIGSVHQWTSDWYAEFKSEAQTDPQGPGSGKGVVLRGSTWENSRRQARVSYRDIGPAKGSGRYYYNGFRCVMQ